MVSPEEGGGEGGRDREREREEEREGERRKGEIVRVSERETEEGGRDCV